MTSSLLLITKDLVMLIEGSITEYFSSVLAADRNLDRGTLENDNLLFKDHFVHTITIVRHYIKKTISAKCRAEKKKSTTSEVNACSCAL